MTGRENRSSSAAKLQMKVPFACIATSPVYYDVSAANYTEFLVYHLKEFKSKDRTFSKPFNEIVQNGLNLSAAQFWEWIPFLQYILRQREQNTVTQNLHNSNINFELFGHFGHGE